MAKRSTNPDKPPNPSDNLDVELEPLTPRFAIVGSDLIIASAILGGLAGLLFPAVEAGRVISGLGPIFPDLMWLHQRTFPLPMIVGSGILSLFSYVAFSLLRFIAPARMLKHLPWRQRRNHPR